MLEEAGKPDSLPKRIKSPSFLRRPEKTDVEREHQPSQAGPLPSVVRELAALATCLSEFGHQGKNNKPKQKYCSEQVTARSTEV